MKRLAWTNLYSSVYFPRTCWYNSVSPPGWPSPRTPAPNRIPSWKHLYTRSDEPLSRQQPKRRERRTDANKTTYYATCNRFCEYFPASTFPHKVTLNRKTPSRTPYKRHTRIPGFQSLYTIVQSPNPSYSCSRYATRRYLRTSTLSTTLTSKPTKR